MMRINTYNNYSPFIDTETLNRFIKDDGETTNIYLRHGQIAVAMDIEIYTSDDDNKGKTNRYVLSGDLVAGRITRTVKHDNTVQESKYYYHLDHLNSTKAVTKEDATIDVQYEYRAFGEQLKRLGEGEAKYTYGGKELDSQTNLYYFNARYYDATIGRFINVDPIQDGMNWYVYCSNNPLSFVDPTGLFLKFIFKVMTKPLQAIMQPRTPIDYAIKKSAETIEKSVPIVNKVSNKIGEVATATGTIATLIPGGQAVGTTASIVGGSALTISKATENDVNRIQEKQISKLKNENSQLKSKLNDLQKQLESLKSQLNNNNNKEINSSNIQNDINNKPSKTPVPKNEAKKGIKDI